MLSQQYMGRGTDYVISCQIFPKQGKVNKPNGYHYKISLDLFIDYHL